MNPTTAHDFYKADHKRQYPENSTLVYSGWTPRSARLAPVLEQYFDNKVVFFGLQALIIDYLIREWNDKFFAVSKSVACKHYKRRMDTSLGKDKVSITELEALHDLGYLPIEIKALPEGSRVNIKVPMFTVKNTLAPFFWIVNFFETVLSCEIWKPCTTATIAYEYRKILENYARITGSSFDFIDIQAHDFSMRGMSGRHDAAISGMGHLLSFVGTDTIPAIDAAEEFYYANSDNELVGCSVPATEHSVMCMGGSGENEIETFRRLIEDVYPTGIVSIVSDTWDFWKVITEYAVILKDKIMARQPCELGLNKVVFRPDSGCPIKILTGYTESEIIRNDDGRIYVKTPQDDPSHADYNKTRVATMLTESEVKGAVECLWDIFGGTQSETGYRLLDEHVGLIYGDSITLERCDTILSRLADKGFASGNVVFGVGSYTYQYLTRDTFGFAMKATYGEVDGVGRELFKDPITDSGVKKSAKGLMRVEREGDDFVLYDQQTLEGEKQGELKTVFIDGELVNPLTLQQIRDTIRNS